MLVLTIVGCAARARAQDLDIVPALRAGDTFRLEIAKSRLESPDPEKTARSTTTVDVQVVSVSADGTTLEWSAGETTFGDGRTAPDLIAYAAAVALDGLRLRIGLKPDGEFAGLVNEPEVMPKLQAAANLMVQGVGDSIPEHDRKAFEALIAQLLSPTTLLAASTTDAKTYFSLNGATIAAGEVIEVDLDQPNPLTGGTIPSRFRIKAESVTADTAVFVTSTMFDAAAFMQIMRTLIEKSGKDVSADELAAFQPAEMGDEGRFVFDRATGLMREVKVRRRINAGSIQRLDTWDIRLVRAPKR